MPTQAGHREDETRSIKTAKCQTGCRRTTEIHPSRDALVHTHTYPYVSRVQQEISEGSVVFGGEDVVLGVNDVQTQRAKLFYLH